MLEEANLKDGDAILSGAANPDDPAQASSHPEPSLAGPAVRKPSFRYLVGALAGGNLVSSILRMAGGLLQARFTAPDMLGLFNGIGLIQGYTRFLQLGILNGLNRELPYYYGKGDHQRVQALAAVALAWALVLGTTVALALCGIAGWYLVHGDGWMAAAWLANAVVAFQFFYGSMYLQSTYRTAHDFARLSLVNVIQHVLALALVVLVAFMNFYGLCLRMILVALRAWPFSTPGVRSACFRHGTGRIGYTCWSSACRSSSWGNWPSSGDAGRHAGLRILGRRDMGFYAMVVVAARRWSCCLWPLRK